MIVCDQNYFNLSTVLNGVITTVAKTTAILPNKNQKLAKYIKWLLQQILNSILILLKSTEKKGHEIMFEVKILKAIANFLDITTNVRSMEKLRSISSPV